MKLRSQHLGLWAWRIEEDSMILCAEKQSAFIISIPKGKKGIHDITPR